MRYDFHILQPVVRSSVVSLRAGRNDNHFRGNGIAGNQMVQRCRWFDLVRHCHRVHESGNGVAVNDGRLGLVVDRHNTASEGVTFLGRNAMA